MTVNVPFALPKSNAETNTAKVCMEKGTVPVGMMIHEQTAVTAVNSAIVIIS